MNDEIIVNGIKYYAKKEQHNANRAVVIVDRGWIFAGDVDESNGRITLSRAVHVFRWDQIGFNGMISDPKSENVTLMKLDNDVVIPFGSEIFRIPVCDDWGL